MKRESFFSLMAVILISTCNAGAQTAKSATDVILSGYSAKAFSTQPVEDKDIKLILECGFKAPSAMNKQPWKMTVVKDRTLASGIVKNITEGNVLIVVSGLESATPGSSTEFDCALATQNMYIAAQSLGLGAHIYASPIKDINSTKKEAIGIPEGYKAVTVLRIGYMDKDVDATSAASPRKAPEDLVVYK